MLTSLIIIIQILSFTQSQRANSYICKNPKGKLGDTFTEGCYEYTCTGRGRTGWTKKPICSDFKVGFSGPCPSCPSSRPFCVGPCIYNRCLSGICLPFDLPPSRSCAIAAGEISDESCKSDCSGDSNSCRQCLQEKMPETCTSRSTFNCFACAASIIRAYTKCRTSNNVLMCLKENVSSDCVPCICTLACSLFGQDSAICKLCKGLTEAPPLMSVADFWAPSCYGCNPPPPKTYRCPIGWSISQDEKPSCFKVFASSTEGSWTQGKNIFCPGLGAEVQLAVSDTDEKIDAIENAIANFPGNDEQSWIAGKQSGAIFNWVPRSGTPFSLTNSRNFLSGCPKQLTGSCLYVQTGGFWCNDSCDKTKTLVCEQPATLQ